MTGSTLTRAYFCAQANYSFCIRGTLLLREISIILSVKLKEFFAVL
jgi:hypothetical protein